MPRTASIHKTTRAARKTRAASEISAPVLFRFPDLSPAAETGEVDSVPAPQPAEEATAAMQVRANAETEAQTADAGDLTASSPIQPKPVSPQSDPSREDAPRVDAAAVAAHRTWWEHWSSGIVLLLLVCALFAAGVMAFSDRSGPSDSHLADAGTAELNIPTLSDIDIPDIDASLTQAIDTETAVQETELPVEEPTLAQSQPEPVLSTDSLAVDQASETDGHVVEASDAANSLVPNTFVLGGETLTGPALSIKVAPPSEQSVEKAGGLPSEQSVAKATVGMPIVDGTDSSLDTQPDQQVGFSLPALPASSITRQPGESPGMYDGAMVGTPKSTQQDQQEVPPLPSPMVQPSQSNESAGTLVPSSLATTNTSQDTNTPSPTVKPQAQLASGPNQLPIQDASHTTTRPSGSQPVVTASGTMMTASPDLDQEAIVRQWRQYKAKQLTAQPESYLPPPAR